MKKIESVELVEADIKEAIIYWLNKDGGTEHDYDISFEMERESIDPPPGVSVGGMSDWYADVVKATAIKRK